jgi:O-antigen/teichoic acid export membrane protein
MLASVVVSGLYIFVSPMFNALYPRFTGMVAANDDAGVSSLYRIGTRALGCILFPLAMVLVLFSGDIVRLWTGDAAIANAIAPVIALLAVGSALHGVMHVPHAMQLAYGETRLPLAINSILVVILVPLIIVLALSLGARGGALAWLILHILYVGVGSWLTHRRLLVGQRREWLLHDIGTPLLVSLAVGAAVAGVLATLSVAPVGRALLCIAAFVAAVLTTLVFSPLLQDALAPHLPRRLRLGAESRRHRSTFGWNAKK